MKPKPTGIPRCKDCVYCELRTGYNDRYKCNYWHNTTSKDDFWDRQGLLRSGAKATTSGYVASKHVSGGTPWKINYFT